MRRRFWIACALAAAALAPRPNVVLYLVDTLRADHLGVYGYERDTSPALDRWAEQSVVFERAYAPSSWTRPSVVSLLSGLDPIRHGVEDRLDAIPGDVRLLSETLKENGYATLAAVTNPNVLPAWGFGRGFDVFDDLDSAGHGTRADAVTDHVAAALEGLDRSRPFFLYVHVLDPHAPYEPPPPFDERYPRSPALPAKLSIGRYDGEIAFVDSQFGRLLDTLERHGLGDDTLVLFVSDHGEELMDHGAMGHGFTLFEEVVRVPFVMRLPHGAHAGTRVAERVSLIDVVPTVLSVLGLPPGNDLDGRDLAPLLGDPGARVEPRDLFLSLYTTGTRSNLIRGVVSGPHKYLRRSRPEESEALFDLARDPGEFEDRARLEPDARQRMAAALDAYLARESSGVHFRIVNAPASEPVGCEAVLQTDGRFVHASPIRLEADDRLELADEGSTLTLRCRLENRIQTATTGERQVPDEDGLVARVDPPSAAITVERLRCANDETPPLRVGSSRELAKLPFSFDATLPDTSVRDMGELLREAGATNTEAEAYLGVIRSPESPESVSTELRERLRALGYLDHDANGN